MLTLFKSKASLFAIVIASLLASTTAFAQDSGLGTIVSGEISSAKPEMLLVMGAMAAALVLLVVWGLVRRSMSK